MQLSLKEYFERVAAKGYPGKKNAERRKQIMSLFEMPMGDEMDDAPVMDEDQMVELDGADDATLDAEVEQDPDAALSEGFRAALTACIPMLLDPSTMQDGLAKVKELAQSYGKLAPDTAAEETAPPDEDLTEQDDDEEDSSDEEKEMQEGEDEDEKKDDDMNESRKPKKLDWSGAMTLLEKEKIPVDRVLIESMLRCDNEKQVNEIVDREKGRTAEKKKNPFALSARFQEATVNGNNNGIPADGKDFAAWLKDEDD